MTPKSIIGPNAALRYLKAYDAHVSYWHEVNPAYLLGYVDQKEHAKYVQEYAAAFPDSMVVARIQHPLDGGFHLTPDDLHGPYVASPQDYHTDYGWLGQIENVILNVMNEPDGKADDDTINRLVRWMHDWITIASAAKTKSVLFNWGIGQPRLIDGMMDSRFGDVLKLAAVHPELFYMGMHFYAPASLTESIQGYIDLCTHIGIKPLHVIGTEWGDDNGIGGDAEAMWEIATVQDELAPYIKSGVLVGLNRFQEGNSGGWEKYDYENDRPYKDEIKLAAQSGELAPMIVTSTAPSYTPSAFVAGSKYTLQSKGNERTTVHSSPLVAVDNNLKWIEDKTVVKAIEVRQVAYDYWYRFSCDDPLIADGWVSGRGGDLTWTPFIEQPAPVIPPDPPKTGYIPPPAQIAAWEAFRDKLTATIAENTATLALVNSLLATIKA